MLIAVLLYLPMSSVAQPGVQRLYSFGNPNQSGATPIGSLLIGSDGFFYGTTLGGGISNYGTIYKINTNGTGYAVLHAFGVSPGDGRTPYNGVVQVSSGTLYGTTFSGGSNGVGTIFRINPDGTGYTVLYSFLGAGGDGLNPYSGLIQGTDGVLYGTTESGGTSGGFGTVFKINTNGTGYAVIHNFGSVGGDGESPAGTLRQGSDGALYGTTQSGGSTNSGTVYKLNPDGSGYSLLHSFQGYPADGERPAARLLLGNDGVLYGTTDLGGTNNSGALFKINTNGTGYVLLHSLNGGTDGSDISGPLIQGADGALYGTAAIGGTNLNGTLFKMATDGSGFVVIHSFTNTPTDGYWPSDGLVQLPNGALFGTTQYGGYAQQGSLFTLSTNGTSFATLYMFSQLGGDGSEPTAPLLQGANGVLYGTTQFGGTENRGTVFKVNTNGTGYTVLHNFLINGSDGQNPQAGLLQGQDAALYGVTFSGGSNQFGTVFKLNPDGSGYAVLYQFGAMVADGQNPRSLLQGRDGMLYGVTQAGGTNLNGAVFKLNTSGTGYSILYNFSTVLPDGAHPRGLLQANDGILYGTASGGGSNGQGCIFALSTNGTNYRLVYSFGNSATDAKAPNAGLVQGADRALYGTTFIGGISNRGTVFKVNTDGSGYALLHSFTQTGDGIRPQADLMQANDGLLYGTTQLGGSSGVGTVFGLNASGTLYAVVNHFDQVAGDGKGPQAGLLQGLDGGWYGTTTFGGDMNVGTVFRFMPIPFIVQQPSSFAGYLYAPGTFSVQVASLRPVSYQWLFNSNPLPGATSSAVSVLIGPGQVGGYSVIASNIYGAVTSTVATLTMLAPTQALQTVVLHNFGAAPGDGQWPMAGLLQATNGQLFGTTYGGGAFGNGTVFLLNTNGTGYATRAQFGAVPGDAARPEAALIQGSDGALYGTATAGGAYDYGAAFRIANPAGPGAPVLIHSFGGSERGDGSEPYAALLQLSDGFLYGATVLDGASGYGTLFRLSTDGATYSLRNSFSAAGSGGIHPYATLALGVDGALYGSTHSGGAYGYGTVFRLANPASGPAPQWLHSFTNSAGDGAYPYSGVAQSSDGTLYGTTWSGGAAGAGTVFGLNADGSGYAVRVNFSGTNGSGANPYSAVVGGNDGALYGTTYSGGTAGYGTVFRIKNPAGVPVLDYLHSFSNTNGDGAYPVAGLLQGTDGSLYGTTSAGGSANGGTVYTLAFDPRIAVPPTNQLVAAGSAVTFIAVGAGTGPLTYQWLFNGNPLSGATNSTLTLNNVTTNQAGVYALVVFGAAGTVTSQGATLGVVGPPVFTSVARLADGNLRLTLNVVPNANYSIQTSSNLVSWAVQTNVFATSSSVQISDLTATNAARRFYRAVWVP